MIFFPKWFELIFIDLVRCAEEHRIKVLFYSVEKGAVERNMLH